MGANRDLTAVQHVCWSQAARPGGRLSAQLSPRDQVNEGRCRRPVGGLGLGAAWLEAGGGMCGPLGLRCSATIWELGFPAKMGRLGEGSGPRTTHGRAHLLYLGHPALLVRWPVSALCSRKSPLHKVGWPFLWAPASQVLPLTLALTTLGCHHLRTGVSPLF